MSLAKHYLRYSTANAIVLAAGLVSFPILTRLLDNAQYGILNYYESWALMAVAFGKLGAQHSILRFYPHGGDARQVRAFATNLVYVPLGISLGIWALAVLGISLADLASGARQAPMFWIAAAAVPLLVSGSLVETVLRTTEKSHLVMMTRIGGRWLELVAMIGAVLLLAHSATAAYAGKLLAAGLMLVFFVWWLRGNLGFSRAAVDLGEFRNGFVYGLPLVANEMMSVAFLLIDRVMIKGIVGNFDAVGVYSIGAALAMQVNSFTNLALMDAFAPMANRVYVTEGAAALRALKAQALVPLTYGLFGISMLIWCFGGDAVVAMSGHAKAASGPVFATIGAAYALTPLLRISGYGLLLEKRPYKVMWLTLASLCLNTVLNLWWISAHGIMGAVFATLVSSVFFGVANCLLVPRELRDLPEAGATLTAAALAAAGIAAAYTVFAGLPAGWTRLLVGGGAVGACYALAALALDRRLRGMLAELLRRLQSLRPRAAN